MQLMMVTMMILVLIQATLAPIMKKPSFPVFEMKAAFAMMLFKDAPKSMPAAGSPTMMVSFTSKCRTSLRGILAVVGSMSPLSMRKRRFVSGATSLTWRQRR